MSDALDNANASLPGNPNGYHPAYIGLGFLAPNFSSHEVQVFDCNAHSGCDTADSGATIIRFLAPWFVNKSEACIRLVAGADIADSRRGVDGMQQRCQQGRVIGHRHGHDGRA
jgi:hypothetical protein